MSRGLIKPGEYWEARDHFYIGRNKVVKGSLVKVHGVTAYEDNALVQFLCNSFLEMQDTKYFRKKFKKVKHE